MDPFRLEGGGLDPKNILGLPEGLNMKGRIKHIGTLLPIFLYIFFLGLKLHYRIIIYKKVTSYYYLFYKSFKIPSFVLQKYALLILQLCNSNYKCVTANFITISAAANIH